MKTYRTDEGFENLLQTSKELATILEIAPEFHSVNNVRKRKQKRQFDYEHEDKTTQNPKDLFKFNVFHLVLDTIISSLEQRSEQLTIHNNYFNFLYNLESLQNLSNEELQKHCDDLELYLECEEEKDIVSAELFNELISFKDVFLSELNLTRTPLSTLNYIYKNNLETLFVNLSIALRILLTQPVTVASGERSFSRLKLIKTYLRSTLSQERLVGLALISIENDVCDDIDNNKIINDFAAAKARRVKL